MKRSKHLSPLSHNHHDGLVAAYRLKQGLDRQADVEVMRDYVVYLWEKHLQSHCSKEEEHLLPELDRLYATVMKDRLLKDHRAMVAIVECVQIADNPHSYLVKLAGLLRRHIRFEERNLFPFLERQLGDERLSRIGRYLHAEDEEADEGWSQEFWT